MGGNALTTKTRRVLKHEYDSLCQDIIDKLQTLFPAGEFAIPQCYREKESFGDIDIVATNLPGSDQDRKWQQDIIAHFNSEYFINSNILSFAYDNVQIDVIEVPEESFDFTVKYLSYNDLGGLMHVISKRFGFYIGQYGLKYKMYADERKTILLEHAFVTKNFEEAIQFCGFDVERYRKGFDNLEEIFQFVADSQYFHAAYYLFENRTNHDKFRDQKRKTYMQFLEWLNRFKLDNSEGNPPNPCFMLAKALKQFPEFGVVLDDIVFVDEKKKRFKSRWSFDIVNARYQITGKEFFSFWQFLAASMGSWDEFFHFMSRKQAPDWQVLDTYYEEFKTTTNEQILDMLNVKGLAIRDRVNTQ